FLMRLPPFLLVALCDHVGYGLSENLSGKVASFFIPVNPHRVYHSILVRGMSPEVTGGSALDTSKLCCEEFHLPV
ncbi:MAG: hypothetical protein Q8O92_08130, partial [Candidatus Latescibacter sp.]|nr:hypothetical protein [Candidatus Latescibacter sp.]